MYWFLTKFVIGILMNSIAIISDSFNNLSDTLTSFIAIIGAKISEKPADREHPFGHGRSEYIASLIVSVLITVVGVEVFPEPEGPMMDSQSPAFTVRLMSERA